MPGEAQKKCGDVFIARCEPRGYWPRQPGEPEYSGHWEHEEPEPHMVEDGPGWEDVEDAIAWGRERAARVFVNLTGKPGGFYSAGEERESSVPGWPPENWNPRES
jgi:hypothetical protein